MQAQSMEPHQEHNSDLTQTFSLEDGSKTILHYSKATLADNEVNCGLGIQRKMLQRFYITASGSLV